MKKFAVIYGENPAPVTKKAIELLSVTIQEYTGAYPICVSEETMKL